MQPPPCFACKCLLLCVLPILVNGDANSDLDLLEEEFFQWMQKMWPYLGSEVGKEYNDRVNNLSIQVFDTELVESGRFMSRASEINRSHLDRKRQYNYDSLWDTVVTFTNNYVWKDYAALNPINFLEGFYLNTDYVTDVTPFDTRKDFDNYIVRLESYPTQIDQMMERMNKSIQLKTTYHRVSVRTVPDDISKAINTTAEDSAYYQPFKEKLDAIVTQAERETIRSRGLAAVNNLLNGLDNLKTYMEDIYMPNTRTTYGVYGLPAGREYYKACLKWHLSVDLSPEEVHQIGLREVNRIAQLMQAVMTRQSFRGTTRDYYKMLNNNPRFQMNTAEEILKAYGDLIHKRIYPKLTAFFKNIPDLPIVVMPMPYDGPGGMYASGSQDGTKPGRFYANVIRPNDTKTYLMTSLSLHEAVPGHHLAATYALVSNIPGFRKYSPYNYFSVPYEIPFHSAFQEGWALYAEYLGEEMGVYLDDYHMMGRYADEMLRACRLVVDTGMHYFGWSRDKATRYLGDRSPMDLIAVQIEIDRYLTWPGQACAYKIGEIKFKELRNKAERAMGSAFRIRDFFSNILTKGRIPLRVLDTVVNDFIIDTRQLGRKEYETAYRPTDSLNPSIGKAPCVHCSTTSSVGMYLLTSLMITGIHH